MIHLWNNCCGSRQMTMPSDVDEFPLQPTQPYSKTEPKSETLSMPGHLEKWKQKPEMLHSTDSGSMYSLGNPLSELGLQKNRKGKVGLTRNGSQELDVVVPSASVKVQSNGEPRPGSNAAASFMDGVVSSFRGGILM